MIDANSYYGNAINELQYLQSVLQNSQGYNFHAVHAQQISEKALKSVVELVCTDNLDKILKSHNLRMIVIAIKDVGYLSELDLIRMAYLKDFYYDAKYPDDNYITVSKEECNECLRIMYDVLEEVNRFRELFNYEIVEIKEIFCIEEDTGMVQSNYFK